MKLPSLRGLAKSGPRHYLKGQKVRLNGEEQIEALELRRECGSGFKESAKSEGGRAGGREEGSCQQGAPCLLPLQVRELWD